MGEPPELPTEAILPCLLFTRGSKISDLVPHYIICHAASLAPTAPSGRANYEDVTTLPWRASSDVVVGEGHLA